MKKYLWPDDQVDWTDQQNNCSWMSIRELTLCPFHVSPCKCCRRSVKEQYRWLLPDYFSSDEHARDGHRRDSSVYYRSISLTWQEIDWSVYLVVVIDSSDFIDHKISLSAKCEVAHLSDEKRKTMLKVFESLPIWNIRGAICVHRDH